MTGRPWMKWYPGDWRADPLLRACAPISRYVWMEMIGLMHEAEPYGHLVLAGRTVDYSTLAALIGMDVGEVKRAVKELEAYRVFSRTDKGVIYSRRMVRGENLSQKRAESGAKGGRNSGRWSKPSHVENIEENSDNISKTSANRSAKHQPQKPEARYQKEPPTPFEGDDGQKQDRSRKRNNALPAKPEAVCDKVWRDFVSHRKTKSGDLTETALDGIAREATVAGWPLESALREAIMRGWQGFKAEWVKDQPVPGMAVKTGEPATSTDAFVRRMEAFNARKAVA